MIIAASKKRRNAPLANRLNSYGLRQLPLTGAIIGDGDRKSWDPRGLMIWDNFSIFGTTLHTVAEPAVHAAVKN